MHQVELRVDVELAVGLAQQVVQPIEGLLPQRRVERAQAAFDQDAARHDVTRPVASDIADGGVALHAICLESFDDCMQSLYEKRLRGEDVSAPSHHASMSAWPCEPDLECVGSGPHQAWLRDHGAGLEEAGYVKP